LFDLERLMRSVMQDVSVQGQHVTISYQSAVLFDLGHPEDALEPSLAHEAQLAFADLKLRLKDVPTHEWVAQQQSWLPEVTLCAGLLVSLLTAVSLQLVVVARNNYSQAKRAGEELQRETVERMEAEGRKNALESQLAAVVNSAADGVVS